MFISARAHCVHIKCDEINRCTASQQKAKCSVSICIACTFVRAIVFAIWSSCMNHIEWARVRIYAWHWLICKQNEKVSNVVFYSRAYALIFRLTSFKSSRLSVDSMHGLRWQWWIFECALPLAYARTQRRDVAWRIHVVRCNYQTKQPTIKFMAQIEMKPIWFVVDFHFSFDICTVAVAMQQGKKPNRKRYDFAECQFENQTKKKANAASLYTHFWHKTGIFPFCRHLSWRHPRRKIWLSFNKMCRHLFANIFMWAIIFE